jgi:hypothetical protein
MSFDSLSILDRYNSHVLDEENMYENYDVITKSPLEAEDTVTDMDQPDFEEKKLSIDDYLMGVNSSPLAQKEFDSSILSSIFEFDLDEAFTLSQKDGELALKNKSLVKEQQKVKTPEVVIPRIEPVSIIDDSQSHFRIAMPFSNGSCSIKQGYLAVVFEEKFIGGDKAIVEITKGDIQDTTAVLVKYSIPNTPDFFANPLVDYTLAGAEKKIKLPFGNAFSPKIVRQAQNGYVTLENGIFTYTPNNDFVGIDEFMYELSEVRGEKSSSTTVLIKVIDREAVSAIAPRAHHLFSPTQEAQHEIYNENDIIDLPQLHQIVEREEKKRQLLEKKQAKQKLEELKQTQINLANSAFGNIISDEAAENGDTEFGYGEQKTAQPIRPRVTSSSSHVTTLDKFVVVATTNTVQSLLQFTNGHIQARFSPMEQNIHGSFVFELAHDQDFLNITNTQLIKKSSEEIGSFVQATFKDVSAGKWFWRVREYEQEDQSNTINPIASYSTEFTTQISIPCVYLETVQGEFVEKPLANFPLILESNGTFTEINSTENGLLISDNSSSLCKLHIENINYQSTTNLYFFDGKQPVKSIIIDPVNPPKEIIVIKLG